MLASFVLLASCESRTYGAPPAPPPPPPPAPVAPAPAEPAALKQAAAEPAPSGKRASKGKRAREREPSPPRASVARKPATDPAPAPPAAKPPAPPKAPTGSVRVPQSAHVRIELPSGLQADLDRDPRMQPWIDRAVGAIERCYAPLRDAGATGVIEVRLVMHENERPSAEPGKLPSSLTPMLACVTGDLMRAKMPLFTGKEGTRYTLKIRLAK